MSGTKIHHTVTKKYDLVGKYKKLFDAKRGRFSVARSSAIFELDQTMPTFDGWEYYSGLGVLYLHFTVAPSYLVEDDVFDCFEKHYDLALAK